MSANAYEEARERMELANEACREIRVLKRAIERTEILTEAEWAAATRNLSKYETSPGIPLPQYREPVSMQSPISGKTWTFPDYSQIPGYEGDGAHLVDLDTGDDLSNPCVQDMEAQS
jgi:hypothetical protein